MACSIGGPPPGLVVVVSVRSVPSAPLAEMPLIKSFLPSLRHSTSKRDFSALGGPACIYVCAPEDDNDLIKRVIELRRAILSLVHPWFRGVRVFFYPKSSPFREAAAQAYGDGALYIHHAHDGAVYSKDGWLREAIDTLQANRPRNVGVVTPETMPAPVLSTVSRSRASRAVDLVSRVHLDIFDQLYPPALPDHAVHGWLLHTYSIAAATRTPHAWAPLFDCGRAAVADYVQHLDVNTSGTMPLPVSCSTTFSANRTLALARGGRTWSRKRAETLLARTVEARREMVYGRTT